MSAEVVAITAPELRRPRRRAAFSQADISRALIEAERRGPEWCVEADCSDGNINVVLLKQRVTTQPTPAISSPVATQLYRHFDQAGRLLYIGISVSVMNRLAQHRQDSNWFPLIATVAVVHFPSRREAEDAERNAIREERPIYNIIHAQRDAA
jgi:predicted GIY-YIG superfamily endonuclease